MDERFFEKHLPFFDTAWKQPNFVLDNTKS